MAHRILLVEDEENILDAVKLNLELEDYEVVVAIDGEEAVRTFKAERFDLIVLDVMLPKMDGFTVCQAIRLDDAEVPILFLTAKNSSADRIQGLKLGGDDYLSKPFNLEEFLLRVQKLIQRRSTTRPTTDEYRFGENTVNFASFEAQTFRRDSVTFSARECKLLKLLIDRKGEVVSREQILETVWGYDVYPSTRTIDNYILAFRKAFEEDPRNPRYFHSVRGVGYKFNDIQAEGA